MKEFLYVLIINCIKAIATLCYDIGLLVSLLTNKVTKLYEPTRLVGRESEILVEKSITDKRKFNIILLYHPLQFRIYLKNYYKTKKYKIEIPLRYKKDPFGLFIKRHIDGEKKKYIGKFILYQYLDSNDNNTYLGFCDYLWKDRDGTLCITLQDLSKESMMLYSSYTISNIMILAIERI